MKDKLINLIKDHNSIEEGLCIMIPVNEYVDKIYNYSTIIPYIVRGEFLGFISYYNNDINKCDAFLTMILVSKDAQGMGIGKLLLDISIEDLTKDGFKTYSLEVLKENIRAIDLYKKYGFQIFEEKVNSFLMKKLLA